MLNHGYFQFKNHTFVYRLLTLFNLMSDVLFFFLEVSVWKLPFVNSDHLTTFLIIVLMGLVTHRDSFSFDVKIIYKSRSIIFWKYSYK